MKNEQKIDNYTKVSVPMFKVLHHNDKNETIELSLNEYEVRTLQLEISNKKRSYQQYAIKNKEGNYCYFREDGFIPEELDESFSLNTSLSLKLIADEDNSPEGLISLLNSMDTGNA